MTTRIVDESTIPKADSDLLKGNVSIKRERLPHGQAERAGLAYLLEKRYPFGPQHPPTLLENIMQSILAMDCRDNSQYVSEDQKTHYSHLGAEERKMAELLRDNEEVVRITLQTVFQWFGTNCGRSELYNLGALLQPLSNKP